MDWRVRMVGLIQLGLILSLSLFVAAAVAFIRCALSYVSVRQRGRGALVSG